MKAPHVALALLAASSVLSLRAEAPPEITAIFPSAAVLPANHLKFYLHFSQPMRQGVFLEHCAVLDARGEPIPEPFRETELWSDDRRRLTLWLHPGRQKTGVNLNVELGPVLVPRRRYTLRISGRWPGENGVPLGRDVEKIFNTTERLIGQLDPAQWTLTNPRAGTRQPLEVRFPRPLDSALLARCLQVAEVAGVAAAIDAERAWRFTPAQPWSAADHSLRVESVLEDLAGNSLARPFEVDLRGPSPRAVPAVIEVPFRPAQGKPRAGKKGCPQ